MLHLRKKAFNQQPVDRVVDESNIIKKIIQASRQSGRLNLSSQSLEDWPDLIFEEELSSSKDVSFDSPSEWWKTVELVRFLAADNKLTLIDSRVGNLGALMVLDLHGNEISEIPAALSRLETLQTLNLSHNNITAFPPELCDLNLIDLQLQQNQLTELPKNFGYLIKLKKLDISFNSLESLPETIDSMSQLQELNVSSNFLKSMDPVDLNRLEMLSTFSK